MERPNPTWEELKEQLKDRFSDLADVECAIKTGEYDPCKLLK